MNKILLLLLVTLIQSQSDGVLLSGPNQSHKFGGNSEVFQPEDLDNPESSYSPEVSKEFGQKSHSHGKRSGNDVLMRRSILDKNFMRFGRNGGQSCLHKYCPILRLGSQPNRIRFLRFDRGMRDNFIRFGRRAQDNFIRFGRVGTEGSKNHHQSKDYFSVGETVGDKVHRETSDEDFDRIRQGTNFRTEDDLRPMTPDDRNGTDFLQFFKQDGEKDEDGYSAYRENQSDLDGNKDRNLDVVIRIKRKSNETNQAGNEAKKEETIQGKVKNGAGGNGKPEKKSILAKRSTDFFERTPEYLLKKMPTSQYYAGKSWENFENLRSQRLNPPFFPFSTNF